MKLKENSLACFLLGIICGGGGVLGTQAVLSGNENSVNSFYGSHSVKTKQTNFDRIPESVDGDVVITKNGKKYHSPGCYTLQRARVVRRVSTEDAESAGLSPCSKCLY